MLVSIAHNVCGYPIGEEVMKLISREIKVNEDTFKPQLIVTVALDLELAQDQMAKDPDEYFAQVGRDFVALLEEME
jgi:hypothetical protein